MRATIRTIFVICALVQLSMIAQAVQNEDSNVKSESPHALVTKAIAMMHGQTPPSPDDLDQLEKDVLFALQSEPINPKLLRTSFKSF